MPDSGVFIYDPDGITQEELDWIKAHKTKTRGRIEEYAIEFYDAAFRAGK